jgi:hypothetical protein
MYTSRKLTVYEIFQLLYVDDGAFSFPTPATLIDGLALIHSHLARFGLEVHIGRNGEPSKTECVFFPHPQFFTNKNDASPSLTNNEDEPLLTTTSTSCALCLTGLRESEQARTVREDAKYDALPETAQIDVADGYVTSTCKFKYLGSRISYNLHNDDNINARLAAASQSMGALKEVWCNPHLDTYSKYLLFHVIPINLFLGDVKIGCFASPSSTSLKSSCIATSAG